MTDLSEIRRKAWETRRARYGQRGHAGSYSRGNGKTLMETLDEIRDAMRPFFSERQRVREAHSPGAMNILEKMGVTVKYIGGNCPVQAEGEFDGQPFYFRARGDSWQFHVGPEEDWFTEPEWYYEEDYGSWPDAGWMHEHEALGFIAQAVARYRDTDRNPKGHDRVDGHGA